MKKQINKVKGSWLSKDFKQGISLVDLGFSEEDMNNPVEVTEDEFLTGEVNTHYVKIRLFNENENLTIIQSESKSNLIDNLDKLLLTFLEYREGIEHKTLDIFEIGNDDMELKILKKINKVPFKYIESLEITDLDYVQYLEGEAYSDEDNYYDIKYDIYLKGTDINEKKVRTVSIEELTELELSNIIDMLDTFREESTEKLNSYFDVQDISRKNKEEDYTDALRIYSKKDIIKGQVCELWMGGYRTHKQSIVPRQIIGEIYQYEDKFVNKDKEYYKNRGKYFIRGYEKQYVKEGEGLDVWTNKSHKSLSDIEIDLNKVTYLNYDLTENIKLKYYRSLSKQLEKIVKENHRNS